MNTPTEKKKEGGCLFFIVRIAAVVAVVFAVDYIVSYIFKSAYPHTETTSPLLPFQNGYLATTPAFIASEGSVSEFTVDQGPAARFLSLCLLPTIAVIIVCFILYAIPFTKKVIDYTWHIVFVMLLLLMIDSMFFPPVMTVIDQENKKLVIHRNSYMFFKQNKTEVPFGSIKDFVYELEQVDGHDHYDDVVNADIYAITTNGKVFVGENQVCDHIVTENDPLPRSTRKEIEGTLEALRKLTGLKK